MCVCGYEKHFREQRVSFQGETPECHWLLLGRPGAALRARSAPDCVAGMFRRVHKVALFNHRRGWGCASQLPSQGGALLAKAVAPAEGPVAGVVAGWLPMSQA